MEHTRNLNRIAALIAAIALAIAAAAALPGLTAAQAGAATDIASAQSPTCAATGDIIALGTLEVACQLAEATLDPAISTPIVGPATGNGTVGSEPTSIPGEAPPNTTPAPVETTIIPPPPSTAGEVTRDIPIVPLPPIDSVDGIIPEPLPTPVPSDIPTVPLPPIDSVDGIIPEPLPTPAPSDIIPIVSLPPIDSVGGIIPEPLPIPTLGDIPVIPLPPIDPVGVIVQEPLPVPTLGDIPVIPLPPIDPIGGIAPEPLPITTPGDIPIVPLPPIDLPIGDIMTEPSPIPAPGDIPIVPLPPIDPIDTIIPEPLPDPTTGKEPPDAPPSPVDIPIIPAPPIDPTSDSPPIASVDPTPQAGAAQDGPAAATASKPRPRAGDHTKDVTRRSPRQTGPAAANPAESVSTGLAPAGASPIEKAVDRLLTTGKEGIAGIPIPLGVSGIPNALLKIAAIVIALLLALAVAAGAREVGSGRSNPPPDRGARRSNTPAYGNALAASLTAAPVTAALGHGHDNGYAIPIAREPVASAATDIGDQFVLVVSETVEDTAGVEASLMEQGFQIFSAHSAEEALLRIQADMPDMVLISESMPSMPATIMLERLKEITGIPTIVVLDSADPSRSVQCLQLGADDCLINPFSGAELAARIRAVLRRSNGRAKTGRVIRVLDVEIDLTRRTVRRAGDLVELTPTEWQLLRYLALNAGRLVLKEEILGSVWGPEYRDASNYLRVWIPRLRRRLGDTPAADAIKTVHGMGYLFDVGSVVATGTGN